MVVADRDAQAAADGGRRRDRAAPDVAVAASARGRHRRRRRSARRSEAAALAFGGVDLVVNNAGLSISKPLLETDRGRLGPAARRDGQGLVPGRQEAAAGHDRRRGWAATSSTSPARTRSFAGPNNVAYGAAKADQAHQVRLLAAELGAHGIRVNGVNPDGVVRGSGIFAAGWGAQRAAVYGVPEEELGEYYAQRTLLKREVLPEHVAGGGVRADRRRPVA